MLYLALTIVVGLVSIIAIVARGSAQISSARAGGRIVLHYPAPGGEPMALLSLTEPSRILDRAVARAMKRRIDGAAAEPGDAEILAAIDAMTNIDFASARRWREACQPESVPESSSH